MSMRLRPLSLTGFALIAAMKWTPGAPAAEGDASHGAGASHREAGAHVHGEAEFAAALDGPQLVVELRSAAWNILGFEHEPRTDGEKAAAAQAQRSLLDGAALFGPSADAGCTQTDADIDLGTGHGDEDGHHSEDGHHDDEHDENHGDEHGDDHRDDHGEGAAHGDVTATYTFTCADPSALLRFDLTLFQVFPRLEAIDAVYLGADVQAAARLHAEQPNFTLR